MTEQQRTHHIQNAPTRCPYCHDDMAQEEFGAAVVCVQCLSRHHPDCWEGACASCGTTERVGHTVSATPGVARRYAAWQTTVNALGFFLLMAMWAMVVSSGGKLSGLGAGMVIVHLLVFLQAYALNVYDGYQRARATQGGAERWMPCVVAALGVVTGLPTYLYYAVWGWRPLPGGGAPSRAPRGPEKDPKASDPKA